MDRPLWWYDETVPTGVDYRQSARAAEYERKHGRFRDFEAEASRIAEALDLRSSDRLIDVGAGTGALTLPLARRVRHVHAVDVSPAMLALLRAKLACGRVGNVSVHEGGFLSYEHAAEPADAVVSSAALHHLPDFWKQIALLRVADMLRPGGRLFLFDVVFDFPPRAAVPALQAWTDAFRARVGDEFAKDAETHLRDEYSTFEWVLLGLLERAGFVVETVERRDPASAAYVARKGVGDA